MSASPGAAADAVSVVGQTRYNVGMDATETTSQPLRARILVVTAVIMLFGGALDFAWDGLGYVRERCNECTITPDGRIVPESEGCPDELPKRREMRLQRQAECERDVDSERFQRFLFAAVAGSGGIAFAITGALWWTAPRRKSAARKA